MRFPTLALLLSQCLVAGATVLDPPSLRCVSVTNAAGDVMISWVQPPDPSNEFQEYEVFHSAVFGGPYSLLTQIVNYPQVNYVHALSGANGAPQYYFLKTVSISADTSLASDTLSSIFLGVSQSTPLGSSVLDWNLLHTPPLSTSQVWQGVELEHPLNSWNQIAQADGLARHFEQVISICEDSLSYRIRLPDASGCVSYSNVDGAIFSDVTPPSIPQIVTLSVDTSTNQTDISWSPSPEADTDGYIIVLGSSGGNVIIDTVYGQFNNTYTWSGSDAGAGAESYTIAAIDTCYSGTPPSPNTSATNPFHTTIYLRADYHKCEGEIALSWTPYAGWPVQSYIVYCRVDAGPTFTVGTFPDGTLSHVLENVQPFSTYCFVVKALGTLPAQVSLSDKSCIYTNYPPVPGSNYLRTATVVDEDHVLVLDSVDVSASAGYFRLERTFNGEPWQTIAQVASSASLIAFDDLDTHTGERSYTYRVIVADSCGTEVVISNEGNSILLTASADLEGFNHLRWNGYVQWAGAVSGYAIYRRIGDDGPFDLIAINPSAQWEYTDDARPFLASNGRFCYYVEALEVGNPAGIDATSVSNTACAVQSEAVWIPNAFIAGGYNDVFKPVIAFVDVKGYELTIFNRWGQTIWTTTDRDMPWKGIVDGQYVPQGVYAYYCTFQNGAGQRFEDRGTVTFLWAKD